MKITPDTNVLVRAVTGDDLQQSKVAHATLANADGIVLAISALCEMVWVLSRGYKLSTSEIADAVRGFLNSANVVVNRRMAEAGLTMLDAGGDFADGVIAYEGNWLGADVFVSFDKKAVKQLKAQGQSAELLSG
jgi:predicted nucleic-acid-binding protein